MIHSSILIIFIDYLIYLSTIIILSPSNLIDLIHSTIIIESYYLSIPSIMYSAILPI
jgi:hypothetical protein